MHLTQEDFLRGQRTDAGIRSERRMRNLRDLINNDEEIFREANAAYVRGINEYAARATVGQDNMYQDQILTDMSIGYVNDALIGDRLLPIVPVSKKSAKFAKWNRRNSLNGPDDLLTRRAQANEIQQGYDLVPYALNDYGLKEFVDVEDLDQADEPFRDVLENAITVRESLAVKKEIRQAAILTTAANFGGNTAALTAARWDTGSGDPIVNVRDAIAGLATGGAATKTIGYGSLDVINAMLDNAKIIDRVKYTGSGFPPVKVLAQYLGLDDILVGGAIYDSANIGQTASYQRIWGQVFGIVRVAVRPTKNMLAFGGTFQLRGDPATDNWFDKSVGKRGGYYTRVSSSEQSVIMAADAGFLYTDVVS